MAIAKLTTAKFTTARLKATLPLPASLSLRSILRLSIAPALLSLASLSIADTPSAELAKTSNWDCQQREIAGKTQWYCGSDVSNNAKQTTKNKQNSKTNSSNSTPPQSPAIKNSESETLANKTTSTTVATQQALPAALNHQSPPSNIDHRNLALQDWQALPKNLSALDSSELDAYTKAHFYCSGRYVNPVVNKQAPIGNSAAQNGTLTGGLNISAQSSLPIEASAGSSSIQNGIAIFDRNVLVTQGNTSLQADTASYASDTGQVELNGNVIVRTLDAAFGGTSASINLEQQNSVINDASYVVHQQHIRGSAGKIAADAEGNIQIDDGSYTQCSPDSDFWVLEAGEIKLNQKTGQGVARGAKLKIEGVPVAYFPYARFPIGDARQSGFLFPTVSDSSGGFDITVPYYFNIASNIDATLAPRYNAKRGYITEAEGRWLNRFDQWKISGAYIGNDNEFTGINPNNTLNNPTTNQDGQRWVVDIKERGQWAKRVFSRVDYTRVSDNDYLRDLNTTSLSVNRTTHLNQRIAMDYIGDAWTAGLNIHQYQTIDNNIDAVKPFEKTPELWLAYQSLAKPFRIGSNAKLLYSAFEHDDLNAGERSYGEFNIDYPMRWGGISVAPAIGVQHLQYNLDKPNNAATNTDYRPSVSAPQAQLKMDMTFEKRMVKTTGGKSTTRRRTLEPGLFYLYRDADDQSDFPLFDTNLLTINRNQLGRNSAFSGYDRLEDSNQAAIYVTHRRFDAHGNEALAATIGQIQYFDNLPDNSSNSTALTTARQSDQNNSAIITDLEANLGHGWQSRATALWDSNDNLLDEGSLLFRYRNKKHHASIVNIGYHYRLADKRNSLLQRDIEQADLSFVTAINKRWALIGRYQYDTTAARSNESLAGIEYNDCCVKWRVVYRDGLVYNGDGRENQRDRSLFLQIELKGLFGIGDSVENILDESIAGYKALSGSNQSRSVNSNDYSDLTGTRHTSF